MGEHNTFGELGEKLAVEFLLKKGYVIQRRNYRYVKAEIDIIAQKGNTLAIIEVKSRSSELWGDVAETVSKKKITLLVTAADHYVTTNDLDVEVRFDIITILKKGKDFHITHLEDAFYHF